MKNKKQTIYHIRYEFRPTTDQWYPNYDGDLVKISVYEYSKGGAKVCVWGADDFGMEIMVGTRMQALDIFNALPKVITQEDLKLRGFVRC
jgi:hypothetical protein